MPRVSSLTSRQQADLALASRDAVERQFTRLMPHIHSGSWLGKCNRYRNDCMKKIRNDKHCPQSPRQLADYVAASSVLHCSDGWSFLGRALDAHVRGDPNTSRHMAYYAELRAGMSILGAEGIGVFDGYHHVVKAGGTCHPLSGDLLPTHTFVWLALQHWVTQSSSDVLLMDVIAPDGVSLRDWVSRFYMAPPSSLPLAGKWFNAWGLDLMRLADDRDARNEASYRPSHLNPMQALDALAIARFLHDFWMVFEPSPGAPFALLDRQLLRLSLEQSYKAITRKTATAKGSRQAFAARLDGMLGTLSMGSSRSAAWKEFLMRQTEPDNAVLIQLASGTVSQQDPRHHLQVMVRAALLLRVATGACARLLRVAGLISDDLSFWWRPLGQGRGLWEPGTGPSDCADLWSDVRAALDEVGTWDAANAAVQPSVNKWLKEQAQAASTLGSAERIALWGLGL